MGESECGCGGGPVGPKALKVPTMTAPRISKVQARKRAQEATRRANAARAARDKANIDDAADFLVAVGSIAEVESWKKERLARLREQVDAEAAKRVAIHRAKAGAVVARMQGRGETLATIAARTDVGIGIVRAMARHASKQKTPPVTRNGSDALGERRTEFSPVSSAGGS